MTFLTTRTSPAPRFVGRTAFAHKGGMHVNAVRKLARSYEHIEPASVGNEQNILVSELSGQANILSKAEELGLPLAKGSTEAAAILQRVKQLENDGYSFEAADGTLELLIRRELGDHQKPFDLTEYHTSFRQYRDGHPPVCEATVKLVVDGTPELTVAEGHGVVNALDLALRKALLPFYPEIAGVSLVDYKVRIIDGHDATAAKTRVLIVSTDGGTHWGTVGVSENIIEASWLALVDGIDLFLQRRKAALLGMRIIFEGFLGAFLIGFLGTAFPRLQEIGRGLAGSSSLLLLWTPPWRAMRRAGWRRGRRPSAC